MIDNNCNKDDIKKYIRRLSVLFRFPYDLAVRQIEAESNFNCFAVSRVGAFGLAQFLPSTFEYVKAYIFSHNIDKFLVDNDISFNLDYTSNSGQLVCYFVYMSIILPNELAGVGVTATYEHLVRAYNSGSGRVLQSYNFAETNQYIHRIFGNFPFLLRKIFA